METIETIVKEFNKYFNTTMKLAMLVNENKFTMIGMFNGERQEIGVNINPITKQVSLTPIKK